MRKKHSLNSSLIFPGAQQSCEKGISWWCSSSWRSWLLPLTMSSFASPLVPPQAPSEKLILKSLTHSSFCSGWLVSLVCCQITSPVTSAIIWNTSTVTGRWIFKGRVTPCGHTNACRASEKVPRTPQSWNSQNCEVLFEREDSYLSESTQTIKAHSPACSCCLIAWKS